MIRLVIKTSVVTVVSLVLLYYGVAWAVLRCSHQEVQSDQEVAIHNLSSHGGVNSITPSSVPQVDLDCTDADYHIESLAGPSTSSELLRLLRDTAPHFKTTSQPPNIVRERDQDSGMKAFVSGISSPTSAAVPPRFLSLSVLRL